MSEGLVIKSALLQAGIAKHFPRENLIINEYVCKILSQFQMRQIELMFSRRIFIEKPPPSSANHVGGQGAH